MSDMVKFYAVGDVCVNRENPKEIFALVQPKLSEADILFGQLETNISDRGVPAVQAGIPLRASPSSIAAYTFAGFDVMSFANNHTLDWNVDAMMDTIEIVRENGIKVIGAGKSIGEAREPAILISKGTKVGFLAYNCIVPAGYGASETKPGCAAVRVSTFYEAKEFQPGAPCRIVTITNRQDQAAIVSDIQRLRSQVDVLAVSIHWGIHFMPATLAMYERDLARVMIDAGADIILGHHAHILKGIEVYKGKAIFYSLCNFAFDLPYSAMAKNPRAKENQETHHWKLDPAYPTYAFPADSRKTIMASCTIANKGIERVSYVPAMVNQLGQPEFLPLSDRRSAEVFKYMEWLCEDQELKTGFGYEADEAVIKI